MWEKGSRMEVRFSRSECGGGGLQVSLYFRGCLPVLGCSATRPLLAIFGTRSPQWVLWKGMSRKNFCLDRRASATSWSPAHCQSKCPRSLGVCSERFVLTVILCRWWQCQSGLRDFASERGAWPFVRGSWPCQGRDELQSSTSTARIDEYL